MVGRTTSLANLKPGDLVAWDNSSRNKGADHIAIYVGGGMVMEAAHTGSQLRVRKLGRNEGAWGVSLSQYLG
jgi:cell wall-associated NlpC family hydrolase